MTVDNFFDSLGASIPEESKQFIRKNGQLCDRIEELMLENDISQKELADKLGKSPAEINKWLNGLHNLTFKTIIKLETALEAELIRVSSSTPVKQLYRTSNRKLQPVKWSNISPKELSNTSNVA